MSTLKSRTSFENIDLFLTQQDTLSALLVWAVFEGLSFLLLPTFVIIAGEHQRLTWILLSGSLGVTGSVLIGISSGLIQHYHNKLPKRGTNKQMLINAAQAMSWVGLVGVGFPLIVIIIELWLLIAAGKPS
ncbi:MAG: hypothetical protein WA902_12930 [Thermosynechococcaceae cyanobacterium]